MQIYARWQVLPSLEATSGFLPNKSVMSACTNNNTCTATYNGLLMPVLFTELAVFTEI